VFTDVPARTIRSGLVESTHPWSAVVVDASGTTHWQAGDPDRPLYYRSAVKALQATIGVEAGWAPPREHLAVACSSHSGTPAHIAIVRQILEDVGLGLGSLRCPPALPHGGSSLRMAMAAGRTPHPVFHNCSGKHAGFLAACVTQGWPTKTYLTPDHPLQRRIADLLIEMTGDRGTHVGIDGCGAPTLGGTIRGLARAFARLSIEPRFARARDAVSTYPALTSGNDRPDGRLAMWWGGPAKGGAQGVMAAGRHGIGIATKSHGGSITVAVLAMLEVSASLGLLPDAALDALEPDRRPVVLGGGAPVGATTATLDGAA
jgi:L-asparaginase II